MSDAGAVRRLAFGTDEVTALSDAVEAVLGSVGEVVLSIHGAPWPEVGARVGAAVASGEADVGVVMCWTGTGVSIAANKVPGVRAALCVDAPTAAGARRWNDANVLALGMRLTSPAVAAEIVEAFLGTDADPDERPIIDSLES